MFAGGRFQLQADDLEIYRQLESGEGGFVILSAHIGCYEVAGYTLTAHDKQFYALVYGGEGETVMQNRERVLAQNNIKMITVKEDMSHVFEMSNALSNGDIVSIPADRIFGSSKSVTSEFMGRKASFPLGPFAVAAQRNVPALAVNVVKTSTFGYKCFIKKLCPHGNTIREKAENLAHDYVANLQEVVSQYPLQWFNYFDFWNLNKEH